MPVKPVKSRLILTNDAPKADGEMSIDVTSTFNMTERQYLDRDPDMLVETQSGERIRIKKQFIAAIKEIEVVSQVAVEKQPE
jgi:hypothetical protein